MWILGSLTLFSKHSTYFYTFTILVKVMMKHMDWYLFYMKRLLLYYVIIIYSFFPNEYRCSVIGYSCFNFKVEQDTRPYILDHTSVHFYFLLIYVPIFFPYMKHLENGISPISMTSSSTTTTLSHIAFWKRKKKTLCRWRKLIFYLKMSRWLRF